MKLTGDKAIGALVLALAVAAGWFLLSRTGEGPAAPPGDTARMAGTESPSDAADGQAPASPVGETAAGTAGEDRPTPTDGDRGDATTTEIAIGERAPSGETDPAAEAVDDAAAGSSGDATAEAAGAADPAAARDTDERPTASDEAASAGSAEAGGSDDGVVADVATTGTTVEATPVVGADRAGPGPAVPQASETDAAAASGAAERAAATAPAEDPDAPAFDIVRVDKDGQTVIAGHAAPDTNVEILLDGEVIDSVRTDDRGGFATVIFADLAREARKLQLRVADPDPPGGAAEARSDRSAAAGPTAPVLSDVEPAAGTAAPGLDRPLVADTGVRTPLGEDSDRRPAGGGAPARPSAGPGPVAALSGDAARPTAPVLSNVAPIAGTVSPGLGQPAIADHGVRAPGGGDGGAPPTATGSPAGPEAAALAPVPARPAAGPAAARPARTGPAAPTSAVPAGAVALPDVPAHRADAVVAGRAGSGLAEARTAPEGDAGAAVGPVAPVADAPAAGAGRYLLSAPVIILPSEHGDAAPALVQPRRDDVALLQPSGADLKGVVLDRITYGDTGDVQLTGRGKPGQAVRIYGNGLMVGTTRITDDGTWSLSMPAERGQQVKLLRLDELGGAGNVLSRVEAPFSYSRLSPKIVRQREVVIQRGDMLWRIAEQYYGEGLRYSVIYGANATLIRDPDLIYPGQVFSIPELIDAPEATR